MCDYLSAESEFIMEIDNSTYQKHLKLQDRYDIEEGLNKGFTLKAIAEIAGKDQTTISKEIRKHRIAESGYNSDTNDCVYKKHCQKRNICSDCSNQKRCNICKLQDCRKVCNEYISDLCRKTSRAPYVCNGCNCIYECKKPHFFYRANVANDVYLSLLKNSRTGIILSRQQLHELDCMLTPLLKQGQSIAHIYVAHKDEIPCTMRTLYNYIDQGIFTARNIDLPKKVKYKPRKKKRQEPAVDYIYRDGRTYKDFEKYMAEYPETNVVEMDTVHGTKKAGNVMLTMLFRNCNFMLVFLLPECKKEYVTKVFNDLTESLGVEKFKKLFPVILTDNGPEFKGPEELEKTSDGKERTRLFYCDPLASWQKAKLEKNHEYIRKVIPQGISLEEYTQKDITLMINHINSTVRASLNGRNPFELAQLLLDKELLDVLHLKTVEADKIILKPSLLKR